MTSVSQALPGFASAPAQSKQHAAGGKEKDQGFDEMVHGENPVQPPGKRPAPLAPTDAPQARRAAPHPGKAELDQDAQGQAVSQKPVAGKTTKGEADRLKVAAGADAGAVTDAAPLQDRLPLLMALSDARHFAASPARGNGDSTAGGQEELQGLGRSASPDPRYHSAKRPATDDSTAAEPRLRSGRAAIAADTSGPDFGQKPASAGPGLEFPGRRDNSALLMPADRTHADAVSSPQPWRPASKIAQAGQSVAQAGQVKPSATRTEVVSQQSFPAPAQNPMSQTASALVDAIASDTGVQQAFSNASVASQATNAVAVPTHVLKIELHPAELGTVTASLRLSGEQLSIEMKPETHEAYRRLTTDSDAIIKSLRGLGFDVNHVTILQPSIAVHAANRIDANSALPMSTSRDQPSFQPGSSGGNSGGDRQPGRNDGNGPQEFGRAASPPRECAGDDMYI
ncbi:flagellar hook-length control protein FliK [Mesorhizobium sp. B1-1-8]|uniref:flagellar hook-length control protein FliK n=1 Tax=Mesorhizobium sp. B1-1-8 TaxID=2589976 RepID=UPI001129438C|nr:flagellar hook-length control protein FliK [Mesorhizobium sp. B1-1-8]UCI09217.1 flagellar hook-length control protein FliK [Mesorhizobium sp. B1-1-8]